MCAAIHNTSRQEKCGTQRFTFLNQTWSCFFWGLLSPAYAVHFATTWLYQRKKMSRDGGDTWGCQKDDRRLYACLAAIIRWFVAEGVLLFAPHCWSFKHTDKRLMSQYGTVPPQCGAFINTPDKEVTLMCTLLIPPPGTRTHVTARFKAMNPIFGGWYYTLYICMAEYWKKIILY